MNVAYIQKVEKGGMARIQIFSHKLDHLPHVAGPSYSKWREMSNIVK